MIRRVIVVLAIVAAAFVLHAPAASADDADLAPFLDAQAEASFQGQQAIVCQTPDGIVSTVMVVKQADGLRLTEDVEGSSSLTMVTFDDQWEPSEHYDVEVLGSVRYLSRTADQVAVLEDGEIRVLLLFDRTTGALLSSDVRNGDGTTYCSSRFLTFDAREPDLSEGDVASTAETGPPVLTEVDDSLLPAVIAGFDRREAYQSDRAVSAYYADGVFSFTLFAADQKIEVPELSGAPEVKINDAKYRRQFFPGQVFYAWETRDGGYVLYGDLPLDLQEEVLADLPQPGRPNVWVRWWRSVFG